MNLRLGSVTIRLELGDPRVGPDLGRLFQGWPTLEAPDCEDKTDFNWENDSAEATIQVTLSVLPHLQPRPELGVIFAGQAAMLPEPSDIISIYRQGADALLFIGDQAAIRLYGFDDAQAGCHFIDIQLTEHIFNSGRLEDLFFCALAPVLRRQGYFLLHAFAAVRADLAILIVGPSGSGKTTAGLGLIEAGWDYLANDVVLLRRIGQKVVAEPTPGGISLSRATIELLPSLAFMQEKFNKEKPASKFYLPAMKIVPGWGHSAPVCAICFPRIKDRDQTTLEELNSAVTFARLTESSVDRWDKTTFVDHLSLLESLSKQAQGFELYFGRDVSHWSALASTLL